MGSPVAPSYDSEEVQFFPVREARTSSEAGLSVCGGCVSVVPLSNFRTHSTKLAAPSDLSTATVTPTAAAIVGTAPYMVKRTIGVVGKRFRKADAASMPLMLGIRRSSTTRSGKNWLAFSSASNPSTASAHTAKPALSRAVRRTLRTPSWSSAIRMDLGIGDRRSGWGTRLAGESVFRGAIQRQYISHGTRRYSRYSMPL